MGFWKSVRTDRELGIPVPRHLMEAGTLALRDVPEPLPLFAVPPRPTSSPEHHHLDPQEHPPMSTRQDAARRAALVEGKGNAAGTAPPAPPRTRPKDEPTVEAGPAKVEAPAPNAAPVPKAPTPEPVDTMAIVDQHNAAKRAKQTAEAAAYYAARGKTPDGHPIPNTPAPGTPAMGTPTAQAQAIMAADLGAPTAMRITAAVETLKECRGAVELIIRTLKGIAANQWPCADPEADANVADCFEALLSDKGDGLRWALTDLDDIINDMAPGAEQGEWARAILEARPASASKGGRARAALEREPGEDDE